MYKIYGPKNPHDEFQDQWLQSNLDKKFNEISKLNKDLIKIIEQNFNRNDRILEAGCGTGQFVHYFHHKGWNIEGVDFTEKAVEAVKASYPELKIENEDCTKLSYPDESFDGYLSFGVIEHLEEGPDAFLKEAHRILKKNGKAFFTVPNQENIAYYKRYSQEKQKQFSEFFEYGYTKDDLISTLERNNFKRLLTSISYRIYI